MIFTFGRYEAAIISSSIFLWRAGWWLSSIIRAMDFVDRLDQFLLAGLSLFLQNINLGFHNKKSPRARSGYLAQDTPESHIRATLLELITAPAVDTCRGLHLLDRPSSSPPSNEACSPQVLAPQLISSTFGKIKGKSG